VTPTRASSANSSRRSPGVRRCGVAVFGSLSLTLDSRGGPVPDVSGYAIAVTLDWVAVATAFGVLAAVPLTRTALAARRGSTLPPRL
jgi:hypothetical protein